MPTLVEQFESRNLPPNQHGLFVARAVAHELDRLIKRFDESGLLKSHDFPVVQAHNYKDWGTAFEVINGPGDLQARLRELCAAVDRLTQWVERNVPSEIIMREPAMDTFEPLAADTPLVTAMAWDKPVTVTDATFSHLPICDKCGGKHTTHSHIEPPKRRGRPPGSKNKPKLPPVEVAEQTR